MGQRAVEIKLKKKKVSSVSCVFISSALFPVCLLQEKERETPTGGQTAEDRDIPPDSGLGVWPGFRGGGVGKVGKLHWENIRP